MGSTTEEFEVVNRLRRSIEGETRITFAMQEDSANRIVIRAFAYWSLIPSSILYSLPRGSRRLNAMKSVLESSKRKSQSCIG